MAVKLADTLAPMGDFEIAEAKDISVMIGDTKKRLQQAIEDGDIGGAGEIVVKCTEAQYGALLPAQKALNIIYCTEKFLYYHDESLAPVVDADAIMDAIGDLEELKTEEKSNLVGAVNEISDSLVDKVGVLDDLKTEDKSNLVGAVNEVFESSKVIELGRVNGSNLTEFITNVTGLVNGLNIEQNKVFKINCIWTNNFYASGTVARYENDLFRYTLNMPTLGAYNVDYKIGQYRNIYELATMDKVVGGVAKYERNEHSTGAGSTSGIDIVTLPKGHKYIVVAHFQINKTITDAINMNGSVSSNGVGVTVRYMPHNGGGADATLLIDATNENAVIRCYSHNPTSEDLYFQYTVQVMTLA